MKKTFEQEKRPSSSCILPQSTCWWPSMHAPSNTGDSNSAYLLSAHFKAGTSITRPPLVKTCLTWSLREPVEEAQKLPRPLLPLLFSWKYFPAISSKCCLQQLQSNTPCQVQPSCLLSSPPHLERLLPAPLPSVLSFPE